MNETTKKVTLEQVSMKPAEEGKYGKYYPTGVKVEGKWFNGFVNAKDRELFAEGAEMELTFYQTEKNGNTYDNFKVPKLDIKKEIEDLKARVAALERR